MSSAYSYLLLGVVLATTLSLVAWLRQRKPRSPLKSVDDFNETLRALSPRAPQPRRRRSA